MPGSATTPGRLGARTNAPVRVAFRAAYCVGARDNLLSRLNGWPIRSPCRRFATVLTDANARLGADVGRYPFIVMDLHHLFLAGLPAHTQ